MLQSTQLNSSFFFRMTWDPTVRTSILSMLLGSTMWFTQVNCGNQVIVQRYLSVPSIKEAKKCCIIYTSGIIMVHVFTFYNGLLIFANYYDCDPLSTQVGIVWKRRNLKKKVIKYSPPSFSWPRPRINWCL